eukprot:6439629-Alexandrium_andersonii.AAC.1
MDGRLRGQAVVDVVPAKHVPLNSQMLHSEETPLALNAVHLAMGDEGGHCARGPRDAVRVLLQVHNHLRLQTCCASIHHLLELLLVVAKAHVVRPLHGVAP